MCPSGGHSLLRDRCPSGGHFCPSGGHPAHSKSSGCPSGGHPLSVWRTPISSLSSPFASCHLDQFATISTGSFFRRSFFNMPSSSSLAMVSATAVLLAPHHCPNRRNPTGFDMPPLTVFSSPWGLYFLDHAINATHIHLCATVSWSMSADVPSNASSKTLTYQ